ncbi:hypothetical protein A2348_05585 [Candidatus Uhrbacteria bacterium RIFOXYB12_FULL_58_10]|nr:MAG: hypothetical protein A2348_05585 [Candidatus Uhrbacteria bacterium RIFOXYB12_FULL_58_10]
MNRWAGMEESMGGQVIEFGSGHVLDDGTRLGEEPASDSWKTNIGSLFSELSTPTHVGERMPLQRADAELMLRHLLAARSAAFWDASACRRIRAEVLVRMTRSEDENDAYVCRKLKPTRNLALRAGRRASEAWTDGPLAEFERALHTAYANRSAFLHDARCSYLCAVFATCLVEGNVLVAGRKQPPVSAPPVPPPRSPRLFDRFRK